MDMSFSRNSGGTSSFVTFRRVSGIASSSASSFLALVVLLLFGRSSIVEVGCDGSAAVLLFGASAAAPLKSFVRFRFCCWKKACTFDVVDLSLASPMVRLFICPLY